MGTPVNVEILAADIVSRVEDLRRDPINAPTVVAGLLRDALAAAERNQHNPTLDEWDRKAERIMRLENEVLRYRREIQSTIHHCGDAAIVRGAGEPEDLLGELAATVGNLLHLRRNALESREIWRVKATQAETQLSAWQSAFGTTQLDHAVERLESSKQTCARLDAMLAEFVDAIGSLSHLAQSHKHLWTEQAESAWAKIHDAKNALRMFLDPKIKAMESAVRALDDWILTYAPEYCEEKYVAEARQRIADGGGTVVYAATVRIEIKKVLQGMKDLVSQDGGAQDLNKSQTPPNVRA